jgi:hypothetical protein
MGAIDRAPFETESFDAEYARQEWASDRQQRTEGEGE